MVVVEPPTSATAERRRVSLLLGLICSRNDPSRLERMACGTAVLIALRLIHASRVKVSPTLKGLAAVEMLEVVPLKEAAASPELLETPPAMRVMAVGVPLCP